MTFALPTSFTIRDAADLQAWLASDIDPEAEVTVAQIDTAGLQLLASALRSGRALPASLLADAEVVALSDTLGLTLPAPAIPDPKEPHE